MRSSVSETLSYKANLARTNPTTKWDLNHNTSTHEIPFLFSYTFGF